MLQHRADLGEAASERAGELSRAGLEQAAIVEAHDQTVRGPGEVDLCVVFGERSSHLVEVLRELFRRPRVRDRRSARDVHCCEEVMLERVGSALSFLILHLAREARKPALNLKSVEDVHA